MTLSPAPPQPLGYAPVPPRPRVWTAYASTAVLFTAVIGVQLLLVAIVSIVLLAQGHSASDLQQQLLDLAAHPEYLAVVVMINIACEMLAAFVPAALSPVRLPVRLGLARPRLPLFVLALGACAATAYALSFDCMSQLLALRSSSLESFSESLSTSGPAAIIILFAVTVGAPIAEELFFRGYLQSRLAARHGPVLAIFLTALFFGLLHMDPIQSPFAFGFGIFLGILSYRSGSIFPTIAAHMLNNTVAVVMSVIPVPQNPIVLGLLALFFAGVSLLLLLPVLLVRRR